MNEFHFSQEVLKMLLMQIDEGIHVVDNLGRTVYYNEVAARHDGLQVKEVVGKPLLSVFPSLTKETSTLLKAIETGKAVVDQAQSYTNIHGKRIETINTTLPLFVNDKLVGAMEIAKDYTTMKRLSEQLVDLQRKLNPRKTYSQRNSTTYTFKDLLTKNAALTKIKKEAERLAQSHSPVLVFGESGTGKEVFAQGIHHASPRGQATFVAQNCAAIPENLLESILFGTAKGSYTGATERPGLFELAHGGTLFLDELHAMPLDLQVKLLRALEDGYIRRVGSTKNITVDVRIMAAMNVHPRFALENNLLRPDLFYRLNVLSFELIPLRERKEDILYLTEVFIDEFNRKFAKDIEGVDYTVEQLFLAYSWPGNVRELKHTIEYMMNVAMNSHLTMDDLPLMLREFHGKRTMATNHHEDLRPFRKKVESFEKDLIVDALNKSKGNVLNAARILGLPRQTLQYKMQKYAIDNDI